jgi:hypothetical protein
MAQENRSAMYLAARMGQSRVVAALHKRGANARLAKRVCVCLLASRTARRTQDGYTPLQTAALFGHSDTVELLHQLGVDVNEPDEVRRRRLAKSNCARCCTHDARCADHVTLAVRTDGRLLCSRRTATWRLCSCSFV